jgi:asparagine synthase (glutamine-hydrolysing)
MSVQFGRWNLDGQPIDPQYLEKAGDMLTPYGPDGQCAYIKDSAGILYYPFHTTKESRREKQPHVLSSGAVLTWDGRLDNRPELTWELNDTLTASATDAEIVAAAYERWGTECFAKLLGDWALAIWNPSNRSLLLAKDFVGTRHLYYSADKNSITWSSILDPLVLLAGKTFRLEEEYIAGWLAFFPATHLTPYVGIHSVPPSCFVRLTPNRQSVQKYWDFDPKKRIRYKTDGEYEEHFRQVFRESVRRRLRSDSPILAELSGGMDSSSIVCMADQILARGEGETPRLDTVSYYNDSEPNWNEKPYFTKVEEKRGRIGCHIDIGAENSMRFEFEAHTFAATPASLRRLSEIDSQFVDYLNSHGNRVVLSGIGGDEVTGGVPTPVPELMDLMAKLRFRRLASQLKHWALIKRKPWFFLLFEATREFLPTVIVGVSKQLPPASWLKKEFVLRQRAALGAYRSRAKLFGSLPSFQENMSTLYALRRQLACSVPVEPPYERRYPFLDRTFLEFLNAIPRDQLLRPRQRRSLMRRALSDLLPGELLNRRRKAFLSRAPLVALSRQAARIRVKGASMACSSAGLVEKGSFFEELEKGRLGQRVQLVSLVRTICLEMWLEFSLRPNIARATPAPVCLAVAANGNEAHSDEL